MVTNLSGSVAVAGSLPNEVSIAKSGQSIGFTPGLTGVIPVTSVMELGKNGVTNLTIDGTGATITINGQTSTRIFAVDPLTTVTINNLEMENGSAAAVDGGNAGAMLIGSDTVVNLNRDSFVQNTATKDNQGQDANGGALVNDGSLTIQNCSFSGNTASGDGGAIENLASLQIIGNATTLGAYFANNQAAGNGGAIASGIGSNLSDSWSQYLNNTAQSGNGGAIYANGSATLQSDQFMTNKALAGRGGAVDSAAPEPDQFQDGGSTYNNNFAATAGGAIDTANQTTLTGDGFTSNQASGDGGAISNDESNITQVIGCGFVGNSAGNCGGAIENLGALTVMASNTPTLFSVNFAANNGGAIDSNALGSNAQGQLSVFTSEFYGNQAVAGAGGAINTADNTSLQNDVFDETTINNQIYQNTAHTAGGAVNATGGNNGAQDLMINGCTFNNSLVNGNRGQGGAIFTAAHTSVGTSTFGSNSVTGGGGFGGAIAFAITNQNNPPLAYSSSLTITQDLFSTNSASSWGGAIYVGLFVNAGNIQTFVQTSTFQDNIAGIGGGVGRGGAVYVQQTTNGTGSAEAEFDNDTFYLNSASIGAGICLANLSNTGTGTNNADLTSLTITQNTASVKGGGVYVGTAPNQVVYFNNDIIDQNKVTAQGYTGPLDVTTDSGTLFDSGYNLLDPSDSVSLSDEQNWDIYNANPGLIVPPANNNALPGFQDTIALAAGSPALGAGDQSLAGTIDERGRTRQAGKVSIGAEDPNAV